MQRNGLSLIAAMSSSERSMLTVGAFSALMLPLVIVKVLMSALPEVRD